MNPLLSYIRHLVSFLLTKAAIAASLPEEGLSTAVSYAAEGVAVLVSWLAVKYLVPVILKAKPSDVKKMAPVLLMTAAISLTLPSCGTFSQVIPHYDVDLTGVDRLDSESLAADPVRRVEAARVTPVVDFRVPIGDSSTRITQALTLEPSGK